MPKDIEAETRRAIQEIRKEVADLTVAATEKVTRKSLTDADQKRLVEEALAELEGILHELEGDAVDVDHLGERVRRAAELIRLCRGRIDHARMEIEQVVAELDTNP